MKLYGCIFYDLLLLLNTMFLSYFYDDRYGCSLLLLYRTPLTEHTTIYFKPTEGGDPKVFATLEIFLYMCTFSKAQYVYTVSLENPDVILSLFIHLLKDILVASYWAL